MKDDILIQWPFTHNGQEYEMIVMKKGPSYFFASGLWKKRNFSSIPEQNLLKILAEEGREDFMFPVVIPFGLYIDFKDVQKTFENGVDCDISETTGASINKRVIRLFEGTVAPLLEA